MISSIYYNFLGAAPNWYKNTIISFLIVNPIIYILFDAMSLPAGFILGWIILGEFIFTLAMAIKCYPPPAWWIDCIGVYFDGSYKYWTNLL